MSDWVPVPFAAHLAGRSPGTIWAWVARGVVARKTVGRAVLVNVVDVASESARRPRRRARGDRSSGPQIQS